MRLSTCGTMSADPAPCAKRKPINSPVDWASPQASEAAVKSAIPVSRTLRWPHRSPIRAPVISSTAYAMV
jgi:hypothetical protein